MKKITLLLVFLLTVFFSNGQTILGPGDIAFVGSNTDGATNFIDSVSFVLLKDIDAATTIIFTDRGWNDTTGFTNFPGDGQFTWTSSSARTAGEVVTIDMGPLFPAAYAIIGDQLFAIQGSIVAPVFIAGLQYNEAAGNDANWDGASINNSSSALPDQLTNGVNAVRLYGAGFIESDNWQFDCSLAGGNALTGSPAEIAALINNVNNWTNSNTTIFTPTANGNCSYNVLPPNTPPTAVCQNFTAQLDANGSVTIQPSDVDGGSSDPEGPITLSIDKDTFSCGDLGDNTVTLTVTDGSGLTDTCTATVTVEDNMAPTITCSGDITYDNDAGLCEASVTVPKPSVYDNCSNIQSALEFDGSNDYVSAALPSLFNDIANNDFTIEMWVNPNAFGSPKRLFFAQKNGNEFTSILLSDSGGIYFYVYYNGVNSILNATSASLPLNTWSHIAVRWNAASHTPSVFINGISQSLASGGNSSTGTDNAMTIASRTGGTQNFQGQIDEIRIWKEARSDNDILNNYQGCVSSSESTLEAYYKLDDGTGSLIASDNSGNGNRGALTNMDSNTSWVAAFVNCSALTLVNDYNNTDNASDTYPTGNTDVIWTATDASGNTSTCTQIITVNDTEAPIANCAKPFTIQLDANGTAGITAADIDNGSTDNCDIASTTIDVTDFDCSNVGENTVTLTVTDASDNSTTCTTTVTVEDNIAPTAVCQSVTLQLDTNGAASITASDLDGGSTDNCSIASTSIDITDFDCSDVGENTVTLTVTDVNGNTSTCSTIVTVEDSISPTIVCPADITANTDPGDCFATVSFGNPVALDNCSVDTIVQISGLASGSPFPVGISTIEFKATDVNGNTSTCSFTITVTDNEPPLAVCQPITIQLDANGDANITATDVDGGSTDQCGIANISINNDTFDCSNVGDNNVTMTVTDIHGNISTCSAIVTVEDVTAPMVACQNITVELDANGTVTIQGADVDSGSTDACAIASYDLDINTFDCSNVGDNPVVLTVTDVNGNSDTCTAMVTVEDNTAPVLVCQDYTIEIGADGTATLDPSNVIASNDDACGILTVAVDITEFSCSDVGTPITVQVFSQDNNGNLATCTATVTTVDVLAPEITCPADQTVDPGTENLFYIIPDYFATGEAAAFDNCTDPVTITTQEPAAGSALPDGNYTITLTAEDAYGNISTCNFVLTVDTVLGTGNHSLSPETVELYPNPATTIVNIGNPNNIDLQRASIYDLSGRKVQTIDLRGMGAFKPINIGQLSVATYMVIIESAQGQITKRLIKK